MSPCLADELSAERRRNFVGSAAESVLVQAALEFPELPSLVPHVFGPGSVGNTTPLRESRLLSELSSARFLSAPSRQGGLMDGR